MSHKHEKGQALVILVFALIGMLSITGLTVDGGMTYSDRRQAQNAADTAAIGAALAKIKGANIVTAARDRAASNGYLNDGTRSVVQVYNPPISGTYEGNSEYVQVIITSNVKLTFANLIGKPQLTNVVEAVARAKLGTIDPLFYGNAVVALNPSTTDCAFDSGNSNAAQWNLTGGGIFSNGCAHAKNTSSVSLEPSGTCVTTVGDASGFSCAHENQGAMAYNYPNDVAIMMPPELPCDGTADGGYIVPSNPTSFSFSNGVYCVSNFDAFTKKDIVLNNATLYVTDPVFDVKFAGTGGFSGWPSTSGDYVGYYLVVAMSSTPCPRFTSNSTQVMEFRGNGLGNLYGTIMAPSACVDYRGNPNDMQTHSQIIGYNVTSNGTAAVDLVYNEDENRRQTTPATVGLMK
jgi:putative Flp pilus-assembly TadE/G-like protein